MDNEIGQREEEQKRQEEKERDEECRRETEEEEREEEREEEGSEGDGTNAAEEMTTERDAEQTQNATKDSPAEKMPAANGGKNSAINANDRKGTTAPSNGTNALTVEKYLMHLRQKEERIRQLEEENRTLRSTLLDKSRAYQAQVDELTNELVRNAEMVARLQSELALNKGASIITHSAPPLRDLPQPKKPRKVPSSSVHTHSTRHQQQQQLLSTHQLQLNGGHSTRPPAKVPTNASLQQHAASKCGGIAHQLQQASTSATDADEICVALQHFVERNRTNQPQQQQQNGAGVVEAIMGVLKGGQGEGGTSTAQPTQPTAAEEEELAAQIAKFVADDPSGLLSGILFGSDPSQQHHPLDPSVPSPAAASVAENGEVNGLDPTGLFALSMLFDEMAANDGEKQQNATMGGQQTKTALNSVGIKREPQQEQQQQQQKNIEFEEVMQRVICGTSASTRTAGSVTSIGSNASGTHLPSVSAASAPLIGPKGMGRMAKKKSARKSSIGTPSLRLHEGTSSAGGIGTKMPTMVTESGGVPIALPKGSSNTSVGRKSHSSSAVSVPLLKTDQLSPLPNGANHSTPPVQKPWSPDELKLVKQLEARIDENIVKLGPRPLNTAELAAQCTRLMRGYSIGQRLFARTVMVQVSQSQGSLSELLSKPRPWHKLTDKGREAFRRIFGWISDDAAIDLLCQLSPRKMALTERLEHPNPQSLIGAGDPTQQMEIYGGTAGPNLTPMEGGGVSMVNAAGGGGSGVGRSGGGKRALKSTNAFANAPPSKRMGSSTLKVDNHSPQQSLSEPSPKFASKENGSGTAPATLSATPGGGRWRHDDIPKEKIIDIYEAEKAKLMEQECHLERAIGLSSASPSISPPPARPATTAPTAAPFGQIGRKHFHRAGSAFSVGMGADDRSLSSVCSPSSTGCVDFPQQLIGGRHGNRSVELPPVQFDLYPMLDTEEVVRQIKERLIDGQISQHQFGKTVLGLSQGSVSDLLARPKPWNSLTNKGREPFIRMKMFLEDKKAIKMEMNSESDGEAATDADGTEPSGETETKMDGGETRTDENLELEEQTEGIGKTEVVEKEEDEQSRGDEETDGRGEVIGDQHVPKESSESSGPMAREGRGGNRAERLKNITPNVPQGKVKTHQLQQQQSCETADEVDTADVARRIKAVLANNGISQRAFGEHILKMTSGCVSDLLTKPKPWVMLSYKGRESYSKMIAFLDAPDSVGRLKADEQQRCAVNNALNALKAIGDSADPSPLGGHQTQQSNGHLNALEALAVGLPISTSPCSSVPSPPPALPSQPNATTSALQLIAGLASGELGSHTPIGALLKKTNSPNSPATPNSAGSMNVFPTGALKRKAGHCPAGGAVAPSLSMVSLDKSDGSPAAQIGPLVPPPKKIPRTIITDKQKEALLFIFAHEQRPNSRCIEQLALKLGLTPRTVTNWFHNYRTRQKAKEAKPTDGGDESAVPSAVTVPANVPTPAQILARALNASDSKTTSWFRELAELLRVHSDVSVDIDSIGGSRGSVGTASVASSPPSPSNGATTVVAIQLMGDDGQIDTTTEEGEEDETNGGETETAYDGEGSEVTTETRETNAISSASAGSQLDKAIARMHSRLLTGFAKSQ
ncbi:hypothetical protein niasHS_010572 [Heterodera schachtii]|uniref:Homeobox protein cut-like n=1 Tax=Heterodera schachtii TaxID=97005 RepID=A0ABD2IZL6_HETSC